MSVEETKEALRLVAHALEQNTSAINALRSSVEALQNEVESGFRLLKADIDAVNTAVVEQNGERTRQYEALADTLDRQGKRLQETERFYRGLECNRHSGSAP